jgi:hypothetical protein
MGWMERGIGDWTAPGTESSDRADARAGFVTAGRLFAISCCVRPVSTLRAYPSTSQPGLAKASFFLMSSHSLPLPRLHLDEREFAGELFAVQAEFQVAALDLRLAGRVAEQLERSAIPKHDAAAAVLALGDVALEISVFERVIFDVDGQDLGERFERGAFGDGPGFQRAVDLKTEIVVQARGVVALHAEKISHRGRCRARR